MPFYQEKNLRSVEVGIEGSILASAVRVGSQKKPGKVSI